MSPIKPPTRVQELAIHQILSAPVIVAPGLEDMEEEGDSWDPTLLGWLDVRDILAAFVQHVEQTTPELPTRMLQLMGLLEREGRTFAQKTLVTLASCNDRGLVYQANCSTTLLEAIRGSFLGNGCVVHRLAIFDAHGCITCIVSQLDIMRFLLLNINQLGVAAATSIQKLGLLEGKPEVLCVDPHTPTLLAYKQMLRAGVSGAAVKANGNSMIANLSISDLRPVCAPVEQHPEICSLRLRSIRASWACYTVQESGHARHPFFNDAKRPGLEAPQPPSPSSVLSHSPSRKTPSSPLQRGASGSRQPLGELQRINSGVADQDIRLIVCTGSSTLEELLHLFVENRVHRVYCVDDLEGRHPKAVLTPTDVLSLIAASS
eukprot:jgi/Astpho2/5954/Aster-x0699